MAHSIVSSLDLERCVSPASDHTGWRQPPSPLSLRPTSRQTHYSRPLPANHTPGSPDTSPKDATFRTISPLPYTPEEYSRGGIAVSQQTAIPSHRYAPPTAPAPVFSAPSPQPLNMRTRANTSTSKLSVKARSVDLVEASKLSQRSMASDSSSTSLSSNSAETAVATPTPGPLARRVFQAGSADLLYDITERRGLRKQTHGVLDLTTLEKMSIHVLQAKLTEQVKCLGDKRAWMDIGIERTLHDYCNAVRDLDYMEQYTSRGVPNDPFLITTSKGLESKLLEDADLIFEKTGDPRNAASRTSQSLLTAKRESWIRQRLTTLVMALAGGMALIAPFLIMALIDSEVARLVTTCGFMVLLAVALSIGSDCSADKVALLTAAYSAALVIYAGNDPPSPFG